MKLRNIGSNMTEIEIGRRSILFSYSTPVAGWDEKGAFRTEEHYSATTTRHINKYLGPAKDKARVVSEAFIEGLVE
jgi:hypothetical protein